MPYENRPCSHIESSEIPPEMLNAVVGLEPGVYYVGLRRGRFSGEQRRELRALAVRSTMPDFASNEYTEFTELCRLAGEASLVVKLDPRKPPRRLLRFREHLEIPPEAWPFVWGSDRGGVVLAQALLKNALPDQRNPGRCEPTIMGMLDGFGDLWTLPRRDIQRVFATQDLKRALHFARDTGLDAKEIAGIVKGVADQGPR